MQNTKSYTCMIPHNFRQTKYRKSYTCMILPVNHTKPKLDTCKILHQDGDGVTNGIMRQDMWESCVTPHVAPPVYRLACWLSWWLSVNTCKHRDVCLRVISLSLQRTTCVRFIPGNIRVIHIEFSGHQWSIKHVCACTHGRRTSLILPLALVWPCTRAIPCYAYTWTIFPCACTHGRWTSLILPLALVYPRTCTIPCKSNTCMIPQRKSYTCMIRPLTSGTCMILIQYTCTIHPANSYTCMNWYHPRDVRSFPHLSGTCKHPRAVQPLACTLFIHVCGSS